MAGKRQHYIPRFLQRGFLDASDSKADRTWLHRRGEKPRLVGIRDVGVGDYFYSNVSFGEKQTLDDLITEFERELNGYLSVIKSVPVGLTIDAKIAACLVSHFAIRTNHVRSVLSQGAEKVVDEVANLVLSSVKMREMIGIDEPNSIIKLKTPIGDALDALPLENYPLPQALTKRIFSFYTRELFDKFYESIGSDLYKKIVEVASVIPSITREAHNKALIKMEESSWESRLSQLSWETFSVPGAILPDCVVLVEEQSGNVVPLILSSPDQIELIIFPISYNKILIGYCDEAPCFNIDLINNHAAECSDNFFISHQDNDRFKLSHLIGTRCSSSINSIIKKSTSNWFESSTSRSFGVQKYTISDDFFQPFSFSLICIGFADFDTSKKLGDVIKVIVQELGRSMPLSSIDGFTFAADYASALQNLDRGDPHLVSDLTLRRGYAYGVAKCVSVKRNGIKKIHIVIDSTVAINLLCDNENDRASSIHVIVNMLSHIAHEALYEEELKHDNFVPDELSKLFHGAVSRAPSSYFSARKSAFFDCSAGLRYADLLCDSIKVAHEDIISARLKYRVDSNLDELLKIAVSQVSFIVDHAAQWIGHRDGAPEQGDSNNMQLIEKLKTFGLDCWIVLLGRDLSRLYDIEGGFNGINIYALDRHAERLLWMFQIFPWPMEDGSVYVNVPMGNDEELINSL